MANRGLRSAFYGLWSVVLTGLTYICGAVPLKILRLKCGRAGYWATGLTLSLGLLIAPTALKGLGLAFLSLVVLIGIFAELEESGRPLLASAFFTVVINALLAGGAFALWVWRIGPGWMERVLGAIENNLKPVVDLNPSLQLNYYSIMLQLPSIVLVLWLGALYVAVLLEDRVGGEGLSLRPQLAALKLPDPVIWVFIAALLGAFGKLPWAGAEAISINVLNVCLLLLFFQGIAVVARYFEGLRLGLIWQFLVMLLVILHLFWFVSLIGLADYWLDFRSRMQKRTQQPSNG